jgi:hypothetical protein
MSLFWVRALVARLLLEALGDAGMLAGGRWRRRGTRTHRELARRWLCGELDEQVALREISRELRTGGQ